MVVCPKSAALQSYEKEVARASVSPFATLESNFITVSFNLSADAKVGRDRLVL